MHFKNNITVYDEILITFLNNNNNNQPKNDENIDSVEYKC